MIKKWSIFSSRFLRHFLLLITVCASVSAHAQLFSDFKKISQIHFIGLKDLEVKEIEAVLPVNIGDRLNDGLAVQIKKSIKDYLQKRGFYNPSIKVITATNEFKEINLTIQIDQGNPCVISSLNISDPPQRKSKFLWNKFRSNIIEKISMKEGDRYDEQRLSDRLRNLKDWLVSKDYILVNTDEVHLKYNDDFSKVEVFIGIEYSEQVTFGFQNNNVFSRGELDEMITQLQSTGLGKDYIGVIQRKITEEYLSRAYLDIKIETKTVEEENSKHVTFFFNEGLKAKLEEVSWEGLSSENEIIVKNSFEKNASRLIQRGFYVEKDIDKAQQLVFEDLRSHGFLSCKLISKNTFVLKNPKNVPKSADEKRFKVSFLVSEGEQTLVGKINLEGFVFFDQETILSTLNLKENDPFNPFNFEEGIQKIKGMYLSEGFLDFKILSSDSEIVHFADNNRFANITLKVSELNRFKVGNISIKGLVKTREYIVKREITLNTGDWWKSKDISEIETNLKALGLFSQVKLTAVTSQLGSDYKDMQIELIEVEPGVLEAGPGFRSDLGLRAFARTSYNNIAGKNWIASFGAEANHRIKDYRFIEYKFDTNFIEPRLFGSKFSYAIGMNTKKQSFPPDFNAVSTEFVTSLERKFWKNLSGKMTYKIERIRQFDVFFNGTLLADDNRSMLISSLTPSITLDFRDSPFAPTKGFIASAYLEYANPVFAFQGTPDNTLPAYQKWNLSVHKYTALTKDIVWSQVVSGGFLRSDSAYSEVPLIKRFRLGGYSTIRGYQEDIINSDDQRLTGTLSYINIRTQIDFPLIGELKLAPFIDAGNLYYDKLKGYPFFRAGAGLGIHYMTPVGPINLDWGQQLNPINGDAGYQIHFSVGAI